MGVLHLLRSVSVQSLFSMLPMPSNNVVPTTSEREEEEEVEVGGVIEVLNGKVTRCKSQHRNEDATEEVTA
jgi:hypothetical protein